MSSEYADAASVAIVYPSASAVDLERVDAMLEIAEALLLRRVPSIPRRIASGELDATLVKAALVDMVGRVISNPSPGQESYQMGAGPFSTSAKFTAGANRIMVLDSDLAAILGSRSGKGFGTIRLGSPFGIRR